MSAGPVESGEVNHVVHGQGRFRVCLFPAVAELVDTMDVRVDGYQWKDGRGGGDQTESNMENGQGSAKLCDTGHSGSCIREEERTLDVGQEGGAFGLLGRQDSAEVSLSQKQCQQDHGHGEHQVKHSQLMQNHSDDVSTGNNDWKNNGNASDSDNNSELTDENSNIPKTHSILPKSKTRKHCDCELSTMQDQDVTEEAAGALGLGDPFSQPHVTGLVAGEYIQQGTVIWEFCPCSAEDICTKSNVTGPPTMAKPTSVVVTQTEALAVSKQKQGDDAGNIKNHVTVPVVDPRRGNVKRIKDALEAGRLQNTKHSCTLNDLQDLAIGHGVALRETLSSHDVKTNKSELNQSDDTVYESPAEVELEHDAVYEGPSSIWSPSTCWQSCSAVERAGLESMYESPENSAAALVLLLYVMVSAYQSPSLPGHYVILNNDLRFTRHAHSEANVKVQKSTAKVKVAGGSLEVKEEVIFVDQVVATRDISPGEEILRSFKTITEMQDAESV